MNFFEDADLEPDPMSLKNISWKSIKEKVSSEVQKNFWQDLIIRWLYPQWKESSDEFHLFSEGLTKFHSGYSQTLTLILLMINIINETIWKVMNKILLIVYL